MKVSTKPQKSRTQTSTNDLIKRSTIIPIKHETKVLTPSYDPPSSSSSWVKDDVSERKNKVLNHPHVYLVQTIAQCIEYCFSSSVNQFTIE